MQLSPVDKVYISIPVTATLLDGSPATLTGVDVAVLPPRTPPDDTTTWMASTYAGGAATVLVAGPDADPAGALVLPVEGGAIWIRVTDSPEVQAVKAGSVVIG